MSLPMYKCPYCNVRFSCKGCGTRHVNIKHPDKRKEYIELYLKKSIK